MSDSLKNAKISDIEIHKMVLAVDEVCANLIIHSHNCNEEDHLQLKVSTEKENVEFLIEDTGNGFDINKYQEPGIEKIVSSKRKGGLGLMLVKRIMDKIEFSSKKNRNICRLVKTIETH